MCGTGARAVTDRPWKQEEREVARLFGGERYAANQGGLVDVETASYVIQVKHRRSLSLAILEVLAVEMERIGAQKSKIGVVVVKRRAGKGHATPRLIVLTEAAWRELNGSNAP